MKFTQHQKVLAIMCKQPDKWFYPYEFMDDNLGFLYVGYKAPTRIAELDHDNPGMFLSQTKGKYVQRKLNMDKAHEWFYDLPKDLRYIFHRSGLSKNIKEREQADVNVLPWGE